MMTKRWLLLIFMNVVLSSTSLFLFAEDAPVVAFDMNHREIFTPFAERRLNYATFYQMFETDGFTTKLAAEELTSEYLKNIDTLVIYGAMRPLMSREILAITKFVKRGGKLLILLHISSPLAELTKKFNILVSNYIVLDPVGKIGKANDFYVANLAKHPLNTGVESLAVYGSWGVKAIKEAKTIALTSAKAWMEQNGNQLKDNFEISEMIGIVAINEAKGGRVIVIADDAPFLDEFINQRSEEHTSELQSHSFISYAVFCLKKKNNKYFKSKHYRFIY